MLFNSYQLILVFLPVVLAGYVLLSRWGPRRAGMVWLVVASFVFYGVWRPGGNWHPLFILLLGFSIIFNYALGAILSAQPAPLRRRTILAIGVAVNLGFLGYFKYANFFVNTLNALTHARIQLDSIILPLGISFFTFQQIAYLVDTYRGLTKEYNFIDYTLFVSFYPQLIAGPIVHHQEMLPQFSSPRAGIFSSRNLSIGLTIFTIGLFKKVVIADQMAEFASGLFAVAARGDTPTFLEGWLAALAYAFQIYFDFSGYSDMAIGIGRLFGIRLPLNFHSPYKAVNIVDFWRRWHMTLSRFLRDYLYIPLGGNRKGKTRRYINLMLTMLLGGLWHGAGWNFMIWGGLHGIFLVINHGFSALRPAAERPTFLGTVLGRTVTFMAVVWAWVFFRAETFAQARALSTAMMGLNGFEMSAEINAMRASRWIVVLLLACWLMPNTQQLMARYRPALQYHLKRAMLEGWDRRYLKLFWRPQLGWAIAIGLLATYTLVYVARISEFIYWQF